MVNSHLSVEMLDPNLTEITADAFVDFMGLSDSVCDTGESAMQDRGVIPSRTYGDLINHESWH